MENATFTHEVKFLSQVPNEGDPGKGIMPFVEEKAITKTATFKELSRTDPTQRDISWLIMDVFDLEKTKETKKGVTSHINRKVASELSDKFINEMLIVDENFTEQDKIELMNDNGAMVKFGIWLAHKKLLPFFFVLLND